MSKFQISNSKNTLLENNVAKINNTKDMAEELFNQLQNKDANIHNYRLLNNLEIYLQNCVEIDLNVDENLKWEIQNFCDELNLEFPIKL